MAGRSLRSLPVLLSGPCVLALYCNTASLFIQSGFVSAWTAARQRSCSIHLFINTTFPCHIPYTLSAPVDPVDPLQCVVCLWYNGPKSFWCACAYRFPQPMKCFQDTRVEFRFCSNSYRCLVDLKQLSSILKSIKSDNWNMFRLGANQVARTTGARYVEV